MALQKIPREVRFWAKVRKETIPVRDGLTPCWVWTASTNRKGYGEFQGMRAHRYRYAMHTGQPIPEGLFVLHQCDNPPCVNPEHLFLGTKADNVHDCMRKGRFQRGSAHCRSVLSKEQVLEIRARYSLETLRWGDLSQLGRMYGVDKASIRDILSRRSWHHI